MPISANKRIPLVRLALIKPFVAEMDRRQVNVDSILASQDMNREMLTNSDIFAPAHIIYGLLERFAVAADDPYLGLQQGADLDLRTWGPFADAAAKAHTIADLLSACAQNARADASSVKLCLETDGSFAEFRVARLSSPSIAPAQVDAFWVGVLASILKNACGESWQPMDVVAFVSDTKALPAHYENIRVSKHGRGGPRIRFPSEWLLLPFSTSAYQSGNKKHTPLPTVARSFLESIRQTLQPHIGEPELDSEMAAKLCETKKRTLELRLRECDTSIKRVIDDLRRRRAEQDLKNTNFSIAEIAARVGYLTPANFSRSFKRWTGKSPIKFRRDSSK